MSIIPIECNSAYPKLPHAEDEESNEKDREITSEFKIADGFQSEKYFIERRTIICDHAMCVAMFGIIIMIVDNELSNAGIYNKLSLYSLTLNAIITVSTVILLVLVVAQTIVDVQLFMLINSIQDWRIALTWKRIAWLILEIILCGIHPTLGWFKLEHPIERTNEGPDYQSKWVPWDVTLSLLMFFRIYLLFRVLLLHSKFYTETRYKAIIALNNIKLNTMFVIRTMIIIYPGTVLLTFFISVWIVSSWAVKQCERTYDEEYENILNSMWLIGITVIGVGYGDMVPKTYLGRGITLLVAIVGAAYLALLTIIFLSKMNLTFEEKHVYEFIRNAELDNHLKNAAANVLRETWLTYKHSKLVQVVNLRRVRRHQAKLLQAVHNLKKVKRTANLKRMESDCDELKKDGVTKTDKRLNTIQELTIRNATLLQDMQDDLEKRLIAMQELVENATLSKVVDMEEHMGKKLIAIQELLIQIAALKIIDRQELMDKRLIAIQELMIQNSAFSKVTMVVDKQEKMEKKLITMQELMIQNAAFSKVIDKQEQMNKRLITMQELMIQNTTFSKVIDKQVQMEKRLIDMQELIRNATFFKELEATN